MVLRAGTPLIVLFDSVDRAVGALPDRFREFIKRLAAIELQTTRAAGAVFYHGRVQLDPTASGDLGEPIDLGFGELRIPALADGLVFQLALPREAPAGTGPEDLEPAPQTWRLDLVLDLFDLSIDGLRPARYVPEASTLPRHLVPDPERSEVRISGRAVLRIEKPGADAEVSARLIDQPDPLDPVSETGFVASVNFAPPHFFIGGSQFGLSVGRLLYDASETYTPPEITERGQPASWMGLLISEATVYAPRNTPGLGDLSGGVKDLLIGDPLGIQGELEIQFGRSSLDPATFQFAQVLESGNQPRAVEGDGRSRTVEITGGQEAPAEIIGGLNAPAPATTEGLLQEWSAEWHWPGGGSQTGDASTGRVRHGQTLTVVPVEILTPSGDGGDAQTVRHPDVTFRFVSAGDPPTINASLGSGNFPNTVAISGTRVEIETLTLTAVDNGAGGAFEWRVENQDARTSGASHSPSLGELTGEQTIVLTQMDGDEPLTTRVKVNILEEGALLFGTQAGVLAATDDSSPLPLSAVENTFDLTTFHSEGRLETTPEQAELRSLAPLVSVPEDALAQVVISPPVSSSPTPALAVPRDRVVEILFEFEEPKEGSSGNPVVVWGARRPAGVGAGQPFGQTELLSWAAHYPGANFLLVGRCGDLGSAVYNQRLAVRRAQYVYDLLTSSGDGSAVTASRVAARGEQDGWTTPGGWSGPAPKTAEDDSSLGLSPEERSEAVEEPERGWLIRMRHDPSEIASWPNHPTPGHSSEGPRKRHRRVDVIAVGGAPTPATVPADDSEETSPALRRSYVPATGRAPLPAETGSPSADYRVKLRIAWDSSTVNEWYDAIPTLAEAELVWTPAEQPLPPAGDQEVELSRETFTLHFKWAYDVRTGYTNITAGLKSEGDEDGLFEIETDAITAALALGPALLSGLDADTDMVGAGARLTALIAAAAFAEVPIPPDDRPLLADTSKTVVKGFAVEAEIAALDNAGSNEQYRLVADYVCILHVDAGVLGLKTDDDRPVKIRYKRVGIEFDTSEEGWDALGFVYDSNALEIEDPGKWEISGVLGDLLRVTEIGMGRGSFWMEGTIAFAVSLGVVEITEATIRLTWHDGSPVPSFELRGFEAKVDIPATLKGEGRLRIEDGGEVRAGVDCEVIPAELEASAALAFAKKTNPEPYLFLSLHVGVQFSTPLPLASSGLAIYGLKGMFTMNGERALPTERDPIQRELEWFGANPEEKYDPEFGQYALGFGAVVGTMPDVSFCFSCEGMLAVGFPDPEVIFGVKIKIVEVPDKSVSDQSSTEAAITGLIVIDDEAVTVGVIASYSIPKVVEITIPFSAYFPYPNDEGRYVYVRIGSDGYDPPADSGYQPRLGEPITVTLLPGTLDVRAWAFFMVEAGGLPALGGALWGEPGFDFDGFAVGFGSGFGIEWKAGPIELSASAKVLVGFGTDPLMAKGGIFVAGKLSLVVVSISVRGHLILTIREIVEGEPGYDPNEQDFFIRLEGEFCGKVDLFFFSIEGCVGIEIGNSRTDPPKPPSPVTGIGLIDKQDRVMGVATMGTPQGNPIAPPPPASEGISEDDIPAPPQPLENNTVWPDTTPVINFRHFIENALPAGSQFMPTALARSGPKWFGASELKYAYRLDRVVIRRRGGADLPTGLQSVWTSSPYRPPDDAGDHVSTDHEGVSLALLTWNPWKWPLNLPDGGAGQPGDPAEYIDRICDPLPVPRPLCLFGRDARHIRLYGARIPAPPRHPAGPYITRYSLTGEPVFGTDVSRYRGEALRALFATLGATIIPGAVEALPFAVTSGGETLIAGYRLPGGRMVRPSGLVDLPLPWEGRYGHALTQTELLLLVCDVPAQAEPGDHPGRDSACDSLDGVKPDNEVRRLDRPGHSFEPVERGEVLKLIDEVDQSVSPVRPGRDGDAELVIPERGLRILFKEPCSAVEVHVMQFSPEPIKATAFDRNGSRIDNASTPRTTNAPLVLNFGGGEISEVRLFGSGDAVVYRVCCVSRPGGGNAACEDFGNLQPSGSVGPRFSFAGFTFQAARRDAELRLLDVVDQRGGAARAGRDGSAEVSFPESGLIIDLARPCDAVDVYVMLFAGPVEGVAFDTNGNGVAEDKTGDEQRRPHLLHFEGRGITRVRLEGGDGEAVVYRICCTDNLGGEGATVVSGTVSDEVGFISAIQERVPRVQGREEESGDLVAWPAETVSERPSKRGSCRLVRYRPQRGAAEPWSGLRIVSPPGVSVTLVSHCGVDQAAFDMRNDDMATQQATADELDDVATTPANERDEILLEADAEYEIEVAWSWQSWPTSENEDEEEPPATPPSGADDWSIGGTETYRFKTAPAAPPLGAIQDGLNEHIFDPRDIVRYLIDTEPLGTRAAHFTEDPVWAHFRAGHVEQLAAVYGRVLTIEVRRTDPPPESGRTLDELTGSLAILVNWLNGARHLMHRGYLRMNEAFDDAPCLGVGPFGGVSAEITAPLAPDAGYDLIILALDESAVDNERIEVARTHFRTSRYSGPEEMFEAMGFSAPTAAPLPPEDYILPAGTSLPMDALEITDAALDTALAAVALDTLPPPVGAPRTLLIWSFTGASWQLAGILIDSLEPLKREQSIKDAAGIPDLGTRVELTRAELSTGHVLPPRRVNQSWTRALLTPSSPVTLAPDGEFELTLVAASSKGTLRYKRRITGRPSLLDREGL